MPEPVPAPPNRWRPSGRCSLFVCDIIAFGGLERTDDARGYVRSAMYEGLKGAFDDTGIVYEGCYREDRGDGVMIAVPPDADPALLLTSVVDRIRAAVRRHNNVVNEAARMRLRLAVHTGSAVWDGNGLVGTDVNHAFRILDAAPFKEVLAERGADLGIIVSRRVHDEVVAPGRGLVAPDDYERIEVTVKETEAPAWIRVLGGRPPGGPAAAAEHRGSAGTRLPIERPGERLDEQRLDGQRLDGQRLDGQRLDGQRLDERWLDERPGDGVPGPEVLFELVDRALDVPLMARRNTREQVLGALSVEIMTVIPRSEDARTDTYQIIRTCLDYPGGLHQLVRAMRGLAGDSIPLRRLEQAIARLLL